ncbi:MAG TPA: Trm112 family protein [Phycisphaerae bacterium]|jgi:uncharacterized protein YbaR (Trm112 family)|nr:Trm112 family protein [Phycisphaerae bacterium]
MDDSLLDFVVCPITHKKLRRDGDFLITPDNLKYPIKDGLPVLLPDAALLPPPYQSIEDFKKSLQPK